MAYKFEWENNKQEWSASSREREILEMNLLKNMRMWFHNNETFWLQLIKKHTGREIGSEKKYKKAAGVQEN
jgi:hypothetical protein